MGVHGLWRLLDAFGQVTTPEDWRGRRVAVDASIWMVQFRSMCAAGEDVEQKILEGFFARILKLVFYGIKPLFVFDGVASSSKTMEHHRRQKARQALALAAVKRRARQILVGQISAGVLDVHQLAPKETDVAEATVHVAGTAPLCAAPATHKEAKTEADEEAAEMGAAAAATRHTTRKRARHERRAARRRRRRRCVIAPEAVSRTVIGAFLDDAEAVIQARHSGEERVLQNALRFTSTSLFMGPRAAVDKPASSASTGGEDDEGAVTLSGSSTEVITVASTASDHDDDADDDDDEDEADVVSGSDTSSVVVAVDKQMGSRLRPCHAARESSVVIVSATATPPSTQACAPAQKLLRGLSSPPSSRASFASDEEADGTGTDTDADHDSDGTSSTFSDSTSLTGTDSTASSRFDERDLWNPSTQLPVRRPSPDEDEDEDASEFTPVPLPMQSAATHTAHHQSAATEAKAEPTWRDQAGAARRVVPFELLDIVALLECFGIPFCLSPSEADAQCAYLCQTGVVDAVFSEDSDVVVHGGTTVLRGFFSTSKEVVAYRQAELAACGLDKCVLVALALLLGCDYTDGVTGIGLVGSLRALTASWSRRIEVSQGGPHARTVVVCEDTEAAQPEFVCGLLSRWRELVCHPSASWETGDKDVSLLQHALLSQHHHEWASLGLSEFDPPLSAAALFYTPEVDRSPDTYEFAEPNWQTLRQFAASRGLLGSTWVVQRFDLAQREHAKQMALAALNDTQQRRLTDFGVQNRVRESWAYKKLSPQFAKILENLRDMRQKP